MRTGGTFVTQPFHPVLFAIWFVLSPQLAAGVHISATLRIWALVLILVTGLLAVAWSATRDRHFAGVLIAAAVWMLATPELGRLWLASVLALALVGLFVIARRMGGGSAVTRGLNAIATVLVASSTTAGIANGGLGFDAQAPEAGPATAAGEDLSLPDIYIVLLDGYPRADILRDVSGADNREFLDGLARRGFDVAVSSRTSYMYSDLTAISLLHGRHVEDIPQLAPLLRGEIRPALARSVLNQAPLVERLGELGYLSLANEQAWDEPSLRSVDVLLEGSGWNEFERYMLMHSLFGSVWELANPNLAQDLMAPWVNDALIALERAAALEIGGPRFAYIHVPSPHLPIVFRADGSRADPVFGADHPSAMTATAEEIRSAYAGQVEYLNARVLAALDRAPIADSAVVILMSDHGPEFGLDWNDGAGSDLRVRFGAFLAARGMDLDDNSNVAGALLDVMRMLQLTDMPPLEQRFFTSNASDKYGTLAEVSDPYGSAPAR